MRLGIHRIVVLAIAMLVALTVAPMAIAQNDTSQAAYGGESAVEVTLVEGSQTTAAASQTLPLTGAEIGVFLAAGALLVLVGLGMWRLGRERQ